LPIPDSPDTRTSRPAPRCASPAYSASVRRNAARSSSSIIGPLPPRHWIVAVPPGRSKLGTVLGLRPALWIATVGGLAGSAVLLASPCPRSPSPPANDHDDPAGGHGPRA